MKLLIGIPAYNEEAIVGKIVNSFPDKIAGIKEKDILVVDDGSSDKTFTTAKNSGAMVIRHILNRGLGGALKTIFTFARSGKYDILVTMDADGQHNPVDVSKIIEPIVKKGINVVIGSRWKSTRVKVWSRYIFNQLANIITFLLFGVWSSDSQSGFRSFNRKAIERINIVSDGMEVSSEFFKEIVRNKLTFKEVPIEAIYTDYSKKKGQKMHNAPDVFFQLLLRLIR